MTAPRPALLESLDERQDDVLQRLDELNDKVERLLKDWVAGEAADEERVAVPPASRPAAA